MSREFCVLISAGLLCLATGLGCWYYLTRTMNKISRIIEEYMQKQRTEASEVKETRESKLVLKLRQLIALSDHAARQAIKEKEAVSRLVSELSHQLKTPLANISMYTQLLQDSALSEEERQEFLFRTGEQAAKMEWLMKALLKISQLESEMISFESAPNGIKETIARSINAVYAQAEDRKIQIETEEFIDFKLLHNVKWTAEALSNILENAIKYSGEATVIRIALDRMELYSRIRIIDQGIGIAPEEYNQIFKRFYRSKQVEQLEGSGLGLYLAQLIIIQEGGYITVSSEQGKGSSFFVYLRNARE